jgi:hypothetical protein
VCRRRDLHDGPTTVVVPNTLHDSFYGTSSKYVKPPLVHRGLGLRGVKTNGGTGGESSGKELTVLTVSLAFGSTHIKATRWRVLDCVREAVTGGSFESACFEPVSDPSCGRLLRSPREARLRRSAIRALPRSRSSAERFDYRYENAETEASRAPEERAPEDY